MAITAANLTSGAVFPANVVSATTASISPGVNKLVIVSVANNVVLTGPNTPTITGAGGTWTLIVSKVDAGNTRRVSMFRDLSSAPGSGALTIDLAAQNQNNIVWSIDQYDGIDTSGTQGSGAIVQSVGNSTTSGATTSFAVTLAALESASSAVAGYLRNNTVTAVTVGSGFTQLSDQTPTGANCNAEWKINDTAVGWTWSSQTVISVGAAIEIRAGKVPGQNVMGSWFYA